MNVTLNEKKQAFALMQHIMKLDKRCGFDTNHMGLCALNHFINYYNISGREIDTLLQYIKAKNWGTDVFVHLCHGVLFINPIISIDNQFPTNNIISKYLTELSMIYIIKQISISRLYLNDMQLYFSFTSKQYVANYYHKNPSHLDFIIQVYTKLFFDIFKIPFYSNVIQLAAGENVSPDMSYMNFYNNHGCLIVNVEMPQDNMEEYLNTNKTIVQSKIDEIEIGKTNTINVIVSKHINTEKVGYTFNLNRFSILTIYFNKELNELQKKHKSTIPIISSYFSNVKQKLRKSSTKKGRGVHEAKNEKRAKREIIKKKIFLTY